MASLEESSGLQHFPHIKSSDSDSKQSSFDIDSESSQSDEEMEELNNVDSETLEAESTCFFTANGSKYWTPKCDDKNKPHTNQHFPTLEDAYVFYVDYGRIYGFYVRTSTKKTNKCGELKVKYVMCNRGGNPSKTTSDLSSENVGEGRKVCRRTTSRRCNCKARIIMKPTGPRGFVVMSFVEEHNHPLASGAERIFLRCNRNMSIPY